MRAKFWTWVMIVLVAIVMVSAIASAVRFLQVDDAVARLLGLGTLVVVLIGFWFLYKAIRFGAATERLGRILDAEDGLPVDTVERSPGGRPSRAQADEQFARFQEDVEQDPQDWRRWYRLAYAYDVAGDRSRARSTMDKAISMERAQRSSG